MPRYCFRVQEAFNRQLGLTTRPQRIPGSTKRAGLTIVHRCWMSVLTAAATAILYIGFIIAAAAEAAEAAENKSTSSDPVPLVCSAHLRKISFNASSTWQEVVVSGTDEKFIGNCEVDIAFLSSTAYVSLANLDWQLALLVKVHGLQLLPSSSKCMRDSLTLIVYSPPSSEHQADVCYANTVDAVYIWVREPIQVYLFVWNATIVRASFSVAFAAVRAVDVCQSNNSQYEMLSVDAELYAFAPHSSFVDVLRNSTVCSSSKQLRLAAASPFNVLKVTVLTAPTNSSCWWLWLDARRISSAGTNSFVFGTEVTVRYERNDSTSGCISSEIQQGFTLQFIAITAPTVASTFAVTAIPTAATTSIAAVQSALATIPGSAELKGTSEAAVIGSAVAAVLAVIAVVLLSALLVVRRHRSQRSHNSSHRATTSVLGHADSNATRTVNQSNCSYAGHYPHPQGQQAALFSTSTIASAKAIDYRGADIVMADNDLYGTAFGS